MYTLLFSKRAEKSFLKLPDKKTKSKIKKIMVALRKNPRRTGTIKLQTNFLAPYRFRVGNYRILFDINDKQNQILIFDIKRRDEKTYR